MDDLIKAFRNKRANVDSKSSDLPVVGVANWVEQNVIELDPDFQRRDRWDDERRSRLIESVLMNIPIPPVYLSLEQDGPYSVIDGKQRITSIFKFVKKKMKLTGLKFLPELEGQTFDSLPSEIKQTLIVEPAIRAVVVVPTSKSSRGKNDNDVKYEVFHRLNTGGIKLEPQEIRNSMYRGSFNQLLVELANDDYIQAQLKCRPQDENFKKMKDIENVLRFFALRDNWKLSSRTIQEILDSFMFENANASSNEISDLRDCYKKMVIRVRTVFDENGFRRWDPAKQSWRDQQNLALYDAVAITFEDLSEDEYLKLLTRKNEFMEAFKELFENPEFQSSITTTTASKRQIVTRIQFLRELLEDFVK